MVSRWEEVWSIAPGLTALLKESENLEGAREKVINYLIAIDWNYRRDIEEFPSWDYILFKEAVRAFMNIISPRNEHLAGTSALEYVWKAARDGDSEVEQDFVEEMLHLFKALKGQADVYPANYMSGIEYVDFERYKGREAAYMRSHILDEMAHRMEEYVKRYPTGINPDIVEKRKTYKMRIIERLGATIDDWLDWRWQFKNVFRDLDGLEHIKGLIRLLPDEEEGIRLALENSIPFGVTPHYLHLMDPEPNGLDYAVRRQVFPPLSYIQKMKEHTEDRKTALDFMREHDTSPEELVTRRYPKVAIIKPYDSCPQICVYCQRNWEITSPFMPSAMASREEIDRAIDWYAQHTMVIDVLVTGGDPLVMSDDQIEYIIKRLSELPHIRSIRVATRIPITVPERLTEKLCDIFASYYEEGHRSLCMVTHFSHPYEVTMDTARAIKRVRVQGLRVYNQQVFTFANSRRFETVALRLALKQIGVDPYYTFNMKGKAEVADYAVPVARILQERKEEARLLPGIFRTDEPVFNVPFLGKNHLRAWQDHELIQILPDGRRMYSFHAWEKNIQKVKPYIYVDVTIRSYLDKLRERGEDPEEYKSIWYYY